MKEKKRNTLEQALKENVDLPQRWESKYGTEDALVAKFRHARQEHIRDEIAEQDHHKEILRCFTLLDNVDETDTHAHVLMSKIKQKFDMHAKMLDKVVGNVKSVEVRLDGASGGSEKGGVSRAVEILGELAARGLERDITASGSHRSVVSAEVPSGQEGHGDSRSKPRLAIRKDEGSSDEPGWVSGPVES